METILMLGDSKILKNKKIEEIIDNNKNAELVRISSENYDDEVLDKIFTMGILFAKEKTIIFSEFNEFKIPQQEKISRFLSKQKETFIGTVIIDAKRESKALQTSNLIKSLNFLYPFHGKMIFGLNL